MIVVLDANVVVSAHISVGPPAEVSRRWQARELEALISAEILGEYDRVLRHSHLRRLHGLDEAGIELIIAAFAESATVASPTERLSVIPDETDNRDVECAVEGEADVIVSGDRHLLTVGEYQGIRVLTPAAFVALLDSVADEFP